MNDSFKYKRYMRNGQTEERTGTIRSRNKKVVPRFNPVVMSKKVTDFSDRKLPELEEA